MLMGLFFVKAQSYHSFDFNTFETCGLSNTIQWQVHYPTAVSCFSSDWQPSFFVSPHKLLNVRIQGYIYVDASCQDDDFVGLLMGYQGPTANDEQNAYDFYLFDWKKMPQNAPTNFGGYYGSAGYCVSRVQGSIADNPVDTYKYFWAHQAASVFRPLHSAYGIPYAWQYNAMHRFQIIYQPHYFAIYIDGVKIFEQEGDYAAGAFGLYSFAQSLVSYHDVRLWDDSEIYTDLLPEASLCAQQPIRFAVGTPADSTYSYPYISRYEWNFGDGSPLATQAKVVHSFQQPGNYSVQLVRTHHSQYTDTLYYDVEVLPIPHISQQPQSVSCSVGDDISLVVEAEAVQSYMWYHKPAGLNYWTKMKNNGYVSGVHTAELHITNVPMTYNKASYRCMLEGYCGQVLPSAVADINIVNTPMRVKLNFYKQRLCHGDSSFFLLEMSQLQQLKQARLYLRYPDSLMKVSGMSLSFISDLDIVANCSQPGLIVMDMEAQQPLNVQQAVLASFSVQAIGDSSLPAVFAWQDSLCYITDRANDTLETFYYNDNIIHQMPLKTTLKDSLRLCAGARLQLEEDLFKQFLWHTGSTASYVRVHDSGRYCVQLTDRNQCHSVDTFYVALRAKAKPPLSVAWQYEVACSNHDSVPFEVIGGMGDYLSYSIGNKVYYDTVAPPTVYAKLPNPKYSAPLYVRWHNGCGASDSVVAPLQVLQQRTPWASILSDHAAAMPGELVHFSAITDYGGQTPLYHWYVGNQLRQSGSSSAFSTQEIGEGSKVWLVLESSRKCLTRQRDTTSFTVKLLSSSEVFVPSLVAEDSRFNYFQALFKASEVYRFSLHIYDMGGREVFATQNRFEQWKGDGIVPQGSRRLFLYKIRYSLDNKSNKVYEVRGKFLLKK